MSSRPPHEKAKTALMTGCDYGLGVELVRAGLARGYRVFAGCLRPEKARAVRQMKERHGDRLVLLKLDMGSEAGIRSAAAFIGRKTRRLDLLINNAGVYWTDGVDRVTFRDFRRMLDVNAFGPAILIRRLRHLLRAAGDARIINVSSEAGSMQAVRSARPILAYGASKAALNMIGRRMAHQLAGDGIKLAMVHPGWMRTPMGFMGGDPTQEPSEAAEGVFRLAARLDRRTSGGFFFHTGRKHPW